MKKNIFYDLIWLKIIFVSLLFFPFTANSSQPEGGWKSNIEVEGEPLTITWQNEQNRPKLLTWMQKSTISQPYIVSQEDNELTIPRKGVNFVPEKLLIIPKDHRLKPMVINVSQETSEIQFNPDSIPENEVWFWGLTPPNPCSHLGGSMSVRARLIHKKSVYANFNGSFAWNITLNDEDVNQRLKVYQ